VRHFVWLSFDLGISGDYEGIYAWLDAKGAKECGDSVACFSYDHPGDDLFEDMKDDLSGSVELNAKKDRIYVIRLLEGKMKGRFIFGRRRDAPWSGAAGIGEQDDDTNA
jgi:hypothetical protein